MHVIARAGLSVFLTILPVAAAAGAQDIGGLQQALNSKFPLTKITDDRSDIVTAGAVLVLHKDGVVMYSTPTSPPPINTYKDGRIQTNAAANVAKSLLHSWALGGGNSSAAIPQRKFVSGEKFFITGTLVQPDGVMLTVYSDAYNDVRYYAELKFPFSKHGAPSTDEMMRTIDEVVTVQPDDSGSSGKNGDSSAPAPPAQTQPPAPMAPIAPPPPPPDAAPAQPKTISIGQTKDMVVALFGQPTKVVKLAGTKEIDYYPDMKVTFIAGKVSNVQ